ncbi:MAG TPA: XrtA system polysaccharide deacetylase [Gemmatimonadaceae bacterium]|nr:XrtA system polysaccharide deacetylase [Gemmatimonadaceae bacterium]
MSFLQSPGSHFFTVDVEEYFQVSAFDSVVARTDWSARPSRVSRSVEALLDTLGRRGVKGTFFVLGWLAQHHPDVVRAIASAGHEVASHGFWHHRVIALDERAFRDDVRAAKRTLEDVVGAEVIGYRAPSFSITPGFEWAFDVLIDEGYRYDSSLFPIRRIGYGYPGSLQIPHVLQRRSGTLAEFPLATTTVLGCRIPAAGGGYLRQFPFAVIRRAFREATERGEPATFYIHPWEIDPEQPRLPVSSVTRLRHYRGLSDALGKIERLLDEFSFAPIATYLPQLEKRAFASTAGVA